MTLRNRLKEPGSEYASRTARQSPYLAVVGDKEMIVLFALFLATLAAQQGISKIASVELQNKYLSVARSDFCICQFGPLVLFVGGPTTTDLNSTYIELFDMTTETYKTTATRLNSGRRPGVSCVADPLTSRCWVIGGNVEAAIGQNQVEIITLDNVTLTWTVDSTFGDYPLLEVEFQGCGISDSVVFCTGGVDYTNLADPGIRPFSYYTDLSTRNWVAGPDLPNSAGAKFSTPVISDHTTKTIYFCDPTESDNTTNTILRDRCYILANPTPTNFVWSTENGFQIRDGGAFVEVLTLPGQIASPSKLLVKYCGIDPSNSRGYAGLDQWYGTTHFNARNLTPIYPTDLVNSGLPASTQISTAALAVFVNGGDSGLNEVSNVVVVADFFTGIGAAVSLYYGQTSIARAGHAVTTWKNKIYIHGGDGDSCTF